MSNVNRIFSQDVLKDVAEYDGIPSWLSGQFRAPEHSYPWPMKDTSGRIQLNEISVMRLSSGYSTWACGYFSQEIANSFQQLYTEHRGEFANVWREIAKRFKGMPEILGYELMNEPWTGDFFEVYIKFQKTYKSLMDDTKVSHDRSTDAIASRN